MSDEKPMISRVGAGFDSRRLHDLAETSSAGCAVSIPPSREPAQILPNGSQDEVRCKTCSAPVLPPQKVYCTLECKTRFRNSRVRRTPATCSTCSKPFMARRQSVRAGAGQCCSSKCAAAYVKATGLIAGENSPGWIDGRSLPLKNRYPEKWAARYAVKAAVRNGSLVRQPCERCGTTVRVHAHHDDYTKPLDVRWLCATHHVHVHMELRGVDLSKRPPPRKKRPRPETPRWLKTFREHRAANPKP